METMNYNYILLKGKISGTPWYDHTDHGENFYGLTLAVKRISGTIDFVPVTFSERLIANTLISDEEIVVEGQIRTYNKISEDGKGHLVMVVFAKDIYYPEKRDEGDKNHVNIAGAICRTPTFRITPFGKEICDIMLAVNRTYGKTSYIPCICWGRAARYVSNLQVGERLIVEGRFQSRPYIKEVVTAEGTCHEERIAYEISCMIVYKQPDSEA